MPVAVIYLSYIPFGTDYLKRFLVSYQKHDAGKEHELIILFNGYKNTEEAAPFQALISASGVNASFEFSKAKLDISSYLGIAKTVTQPYLFFLNTYSQILHPNWLAHFYKNIQADNVGCVGATGSWGNKYRDHRFRELLADPLSLLQLKNLKEIIKYRYNFFPKVSPHIRTTGFMVKRALFLQMAYPLFKPYLFNILYGFKESKFSSECFEHGNGCMTNQLHRLGYQVLLIDKNGKGYSLNDWPRSHVFWNGAQEHLLISDNQTEKYTLANEEGRAFYRFFAWGSND